MGKREGRLTDASRLCWLWWVGEARGEYDVIIGFLP